MNMRFRKTIKDIQLQHGKVLLLWIAIFVGTTVVMAVFGAQSILHREIERSYMQANPASIILWTNRVDSALLSKLAEIQGVTGVDGRRMVRARAILPSEESLPNGGRRTLLLYAVRDFDAMHVSRIYSEKGNWPPDVGTMLVERSAIGVLNAKIGGELKVRVAGQSEPQTLRIDGIAHDPAQAPGWQDNVGYAYISTQTFAGLGLGLDLNEVRISVDGDRNMAEGVAAQTREVMRALERTVHRVEVPPRRHPHADHMETMLLLLRVMASLSLLLSGVLAANLMASMMTRQTRQVGIMKTLGGKPWAIAQIYLLMAALLSCSAALVAVPVGVLAGQRFAGFAAGQLNLAVASVAVPVWVIVVVFGFGVLIPLTAASIPIARAMRKTAREAIQDIGITDVSWRSSVQNQSVRVAWLFALRNSFRRPGRLALTLVSFATGGAMLMTSANVHRALTEAVENSLRMRGDDVEVRLLRPIPAAQAQEIIQKLEGVARVELWGAVLGGFELPTTGATEHLVGGRYGVLAPPRGELQAASKVVEGRWVGEGGVEIVINRQLQALEPHLKVGGVTTLQMGTQAHKVAIVGVVEEISPPTAYTTPKGMAVLMSAADRVGGLRITTTPNTDVDAFAASLEDALIAQGAFPAFMMTQHELRKAMIDHFVVLLIVLIVLALAALFVGVLGLATTMTITVMERQREMGVLKAIGASHWRIRMLILFEGASMMFVSLMLAAGLTAPLTWCVAQVVGQHGLRVALPWAIAPEAIVVWCSLAAIATVAACLGPAEQAVRRPVRELVAYD